MSKRSNPDTDYRRVDMHMGPKKEQKQDRREVSGIVKMLAANTIDVGLMLQLPDGLVITPERELKRIEDLTEEELARNPHITR